MYEAPVVATRTSRARQPAVERDAAEEAMLAEGGGDAVLILRAHAQAAAELVAAGGETAR